MKNLFIRFVIFLGSAIIGLAQVPTNGLVAYYPFSGNANDSTGNGNNGVVYGGTLSTDRFGIANSAYSFDGINDYIKVSNASNINNNDFTYNWWVTGISFPSNESSNMLEIGSEAFAGGHYGQLVAINNNYNSTTGWRITSGNANFTTVGFQNGVLPNINTWYNITVTRNDSIVNLYVNCQLEVSGVTNGQLPYYNSPLDIYIGTRADLALLQFFSGKMDDIRIYNRVLNQTEITSLCNEGICYQNVTVTDTLIINTNISGYSPVVYQNSIKIFPNPTNDQLTIDFGSNFSTFAGYTLKITNSLGQVVYTTPINQQQSFVNLSTWTGNGIYFVHLIDPQNSTLDIKKIVLQ